MNLSGIVVIASKVHVEHVVAELEALDGIEVHVVEPDTGRIVVVQEASGIDSEVEGLASIQRLEHVAMAELVYHYFGEDPAFESTADARIVPKSLSDDMMTDSDNGLGR